MYACRVLCLCCVLVLSFSARAQTLETLDAVLETYVERNGGRAFLDSIKGLRMQGTLRVQDQPWEVHFVKQEPHYEMRVLRSPERTVTTLYDGSVLWQTLMTPEQEARRVIARGDEAAAMVGFSLLGPLFEPAEADITRVLVGTERLERILHYHVRVTKPGSTEDIYIDSRTFRETQMLKREDEGAEQVLLFSDFEPAQQLWIPRRVETYRDGVLETTLVIDSVELNPGVFSSIFAYPGDLGTTDSPRTNAAEPQAPEPTINP